MKAKSIASCFALAVLATSADAVIIAPDAFPSVPLPGTSEAADPSLKGTVLADITTPFTFTTYQYFGGLQPPVPVGTTSGLVESRVVREEGTGTLDFYWRVLNSPTSDSSVIWFSLRNFVTPAFDANWRTDGPGDEGVSYASTSAAYPTRVNFSFGPSFQTNDYTLQPGETSHFFFLHTDATQYALTGEFQITAARDGADVDISGQSQLLATFAPAVPEPATYALLLAGLGAVGLVARRRNGGSHVVLRQAASQPAQPHWRARVDWPQDAMEAGQRCDGYGINASRGAAMESGRRCGHRNVALH